MEAEPRCAACGRCEGDVASPSSLRDDVRQVANLLQRRYGSDGEGDGEGDGDGEEYVELNACLDCGYVVCQGCARLPSRASCHCASSNMGVAYADDADGPAPHMGANGGPRYLGPFKCRAQREMEARLLGRRLPGHAPYLDACGYCEKALRPEEAKLCTRCRSEVYCSPRCQAAAWATHRDGCGEYLPPSSWPYVSREHSAYREHWGRYPTAKLTPEQRASDAALHAALAEEAAATDAIRRAYVEARDHMLRQSGLGDLASAVAAPMEL
eukprot:3450493-Prymnesium_polylepis.1